MTDRHTLQTDLEHYQQAGDFAAQAETLMALAELALQEAMIIFDQSLCGLVFGLYGQAYSAYETAKDIQGMARCIYAIGRQMAALVGKHEGSIYLEFSRGTVLSMYQIALDLYDTIGHLRGQAEIYHSIGFDAEEGGDSDAALAAFAQALDCYERVGDPVCQANVLRSMGQSHGRGNPDAQPGYEKALKLYQEADHREGQAHTLFELAEIAYNKKDYTTARFHFKQAFDIFAAFEDNGYAGYIALRYLTSVQQQESYPEYQKHHAQILHLLQTRNLLDTGGSYLHIWKHLAYAATENQDFATARGVYQYLITYVVKARTPQLQDHLYKMWGEMEHMKAGRPTMGHALLQRALSLKKFYRPLDNHQYEERLLERMRQSLINALPW